MRQILALVFLPFVLLATTGPMIEGQVVPAATNLYQDATVIHLPCGIDIDTRDENAASPVIPSNLMFAAEQEGFGTYLVQFDGPIYTHEREALEREGVSIVAYLPNYAYIVRMDAAKKATVSSLQGVRWMGDYQPGYKICPEINQASGEQEKFVVLLYAGIEAESIRKDVEALGGEMLESQATEWKTIVHVMLSPSKISSLVHNSNIRWVEPFRPMYLLNSRGQWIIQTWEEDNRRIWDKGIKGQGQIVSTLDSGIRTSHNFFRDPAVPINDFGNYPSHRKIIAYQKPAYDPDGIITFGDEGGHGTHTAGSVTGNDQPVGGSSVNIGMAPEAKIFFLDGGGGGGGIIHAVSLEYSLSIPYNGNSAGGARIISNSWGNQSTRNYDASCAEADQTMWTRPDYLVCFSGGNTDQSTYTGSPGNAKNVLSVGGCRNGIIANIIWAGSSIGPAGDGRFKPDIVTPGDGVTSSTINNDAAEVTWSGTSMACPIAAGNAALVRQYFADGWYPTGTPQNEDKFNPSAALVKGMLINSVETDYGLNPVPDPRVGWGRPKIDNAMFFPTDARKLAVVDFSEGLETGYQFLGKVNVSGATEPLRVTLNWTDFPGAEYASPALVNDLNLEVLSPSGKIYKGNNFSNNVSTEDGSFDTKNPVENVFVAAPETGEWKIHVQANNVPQGPQPFALIVTGELANLITSATISEVTVDDAGQANPDGNMDPGENVTLYVSIKNTSDAALTGVSATLSTSSSGVTITDNSSSYGSINAGQTSSGDGFKVTIPASTPLNTWIEFSLSVTSAELSGELGSFDLMIGTPKYEWISHDVGNVKLTVTNQGSIGYTNPPGTTGSKGEGFRFPKTNASSWLYYASFAAGNSKDYIIDRFYGDDNNYTNAKDWKVTSDPDGMVIIGRKDISDEDSRAMYNDAGAKSPKGLRVSQWGYAWGTKDFVILKFILENTGSSAMNNMYAGIVADYDMGLSAQSNYAGTDQSLNLAYMKQASTNNPHVGIKLLKGTKANASVLENPVYVYQDANHVWNDEYCYRFISGNLSFASDPDSTDWSIVVSAGPFNLPAGTTDTVAFAFLAGTDLTDLKNNAQDAQTTWDALDFGPAVGEDKTPVALDLSFSPGLYTGQGSIFFSIPQNSHTRLDVYDISGRLVRNLVRSQMPGGHYEIYWDGRDARGLETSTGIYFITLTTKDATVVRKAVIVK